MIGLTPCHNYFLREFNALKRLVKSKKYMKFEIGKITDMDTFKLYFLLLFLFASSFIRIEAGVFTADTEERLSMLDKALSQKEKYTKSMKEKINEGRIDFHNSVGPREQYNSLRQLYEVYRNYRIDSALYIAEQRLEIARELGEPSKIASSTINLAEAYAMSGNADAAIFMLDTLNPAFMEEHHEKYSNSVYKKAFSLKKRMALTSHDRMEAINKLKEINEKELKNKDKNSKGYYTLRAEVLRDAGLTKEAVELMEEAQRKFDFNDNAPLLYMLGATYMDAGHLDEAVSYLSRAASLDIENGSKEYKALILLSSALFEKGDIDRAFSYINYALEDATFSKANLRTEAIMQILPIIHNTFYQKEKEIKQRNAWILAVAITFIVFLVVFIIIIIKAYRSKHKMLHTIEIINSRLESQNKDLIESEGLKLNVLSDFMGKFAQYLKQTKNLKKNIYRLIKSGQNEKALDICRKDKDSSLDYNAFQEMFDIAFLSMFPDFIEKINNYMITPVEQKDSLKLSPEIRLAALMRLGINSTEEITRMFNYSAQSVYNLRSTLRNLLNISWEEFETKIPNL